MDAITYFGEEKIQSLICIILGSLSIIFSLIFLGIIKYSFYKGMAVPLLLFGMLQVTTGTIAFKRSAEEMARVQQITEQQPGRIETEELASMQTVLQNFQMYRWIEIALLLAGLLLYLRFYRSPLTFWKGLGLGLLLQAGVTLSLDTVTVKKTEKYMMFLTRK